VPHDAILRNNRSSHIAVHAGSVQKPSPDALENELRAQLLPEVAALEEALRGALGVVWEVIREMKKE